MSLINKSNNYRILVFLPACMMFLSCTPKISPETKKVTASRVVSPAMVVAGIFKNVNEYRRSIGLPALTLNEAASQQAYLHSKNMATGKTPFSHEGFEQRVAVIKKTTGWITASAENVAYGKLTAKEVVKGWLNSPGHKKNIEGNYVYTGIGIYQDGKGIIYFTQIFFRN